MEKFKAIFYLNEEGFKARGTGEMENYGMGFDKEDVLLAI